MRLFFMPRLLELCVGNKLPFLRLYRVFSVNWKQFSPSLFLIIDICFKHTVRFWTKLPWIVPSEINPALYTSVRFSVSKHSFSLYLDRCDFRFTPIFYWCLKISLLQRCEWDDFKWIFANLNCFYVVQNNAYCFLLSYLFVFTKICFYINFMLNVLFSLL